MRTAYKAIAHLIALFVVVQAATVAWGTFTFFSQTGEDGILPQEFPLGAMLHGMFGMYVLPVLSLLLVIVALVARTGVKWALLVLAAVLIQVTLGFVSFGAPIFGILHGVVPFAILALAELGAYKVGRTTEHPVAAPEPRHAVA